jgi:hypothetical protein
MSSDAGGARRLMIALALSCGVYLIPLVTAHWADLFGTALVREFLSDRVAAWKAADLALALILQAVLFVVAWRVQPRSMALSVGLTVLLLLPATGVANVAYWSTIPAHFLIEADTAPDSSAWAEACSVDGYSLDPVRGGVSRALERTGAAWVRSDDGRRYGILNVPTCEVSPAAIPDLPIAPGLLQALPNGSVVYVTMERGKPDQTYWLLRRGSAEAMPLPQPDGQVEGAPIVSEDGGSVVWLLRSPERTVALRIDPLGGGEPLVFAHTLLQNATIVPVELDMRDRTVVVNRDLSSFVKLRLDGSVVWGPLVPGAISAQTDTFRSFDGQWLGWDAYVEDARYRLGWSTRAGAGQYEVPRGRGITSAAMDARGRYVAVSTTTALNLGNITDTVLGIRASDGAEVFRRTLPSYSRSQVAFLGDAYFAFTEFDGAKSRVEVLQVADDPGPSRAISQGH